MSIDFDGHDRWWHYQRWTGRKSSSLSEEVYVEAVNRYIKHSICELSLAALHANQVTAQPK